MNNLLYDVTEPINVSTNPVAGVVNGTDLRSVDASRHGFESHTGYLF